MCCSFCVNDAWASHCPGITIISNPVVESIPLPKPDCMCRSYMNHAVACTFFCHSALRLDNLDADIADYLEAHSIRPPLNARETITVAARVMYTESDHSKATTIARHLLGATPMDSHNLRSIHRSPRLRVLLDLLPSRHQSYNGKV